jgi:hypothetical protein
MGCEKYSGWMTDAAVGALGPEREPELLAHAAECNACREAYRYAQAVASFVDRGVDSLVAGEPSHHFVTRLRARIAAEPSRARPWLAYTPLAAAAVAVAVVLAIVVRFPRRDITGNRKSPAVSSASVPAPQATELLPSTTPAITTEHRHNRLPSGVVAVAHPPLPEVLVAKSQLDQLAVALDLSDGVAAGRIDASKLAAGYDAIAQPLEVKVIDIAPLENPPISDSASPAPDR